MVELFLFVNGVELDLEYIEPNDGWLFRSCVYLINFGWTVPLLVF